MMKAAKWALIAFAAYYLFTDPAGAAAFVKGVMAWIGHAASSGSNFASHL